MNGENVMKCCQASRVLSLGWLVGALVLSPNASANNLWDLYVAAQRHNGQWAAQQYDYLAQQHDVGLAAGDLLPQVGVQGSVKRNQFYPQHGGDDTGNAVSQVGLGVRQALYRADKWTNLQKATLAQQAYDLKLLQQHADLTEQIIKAYLGVLRAQAMTESLNAEWRALKAQDDMMQARLAAGVVARVDTDETHARLVSVQAQLANNEVAIMNAKQQLALVTAQPIEDIAPLPLPITFNLVPKRSVEQWLNATQQGNLAIQQAQTQVAIANQQVTYLKSNLYPKVDLVGNISWQDNSNRLQSVYDGSTYQIGIELDWPLYTGGRTRLAAQQGALQAQAAQRRLAFVYQQAMTQTSQAYLNLMASQATLDAQAAAVTANAKVAEASQTGYDLGMRSMVDTLLAQRQYYAARRDWLNAHFDYLVAYVDLQKATGRLGDDTVKTLDNLLQASIQPRPLSDQSAMP